MELTGYNVIVTLKVAVAAVTLLLLASLVALAKGRYRLHGRINLVFFTLTLAAVLGLEIIIRFLKPELFDYLRNNLVFRIHLCFAAPSVLLLPAMLYTGLSHRRTVHLILAAVFGVVWTGTVVTGIFFAGSTLMEELPITADEASPPPLERIIEAFLFVGGAPLTVVRACETVRGLTPEQFTQAVAALNRDYRLQARPYCIQLRDQGYQLVLRPGFQAVKERLYGSTREARLSQLALDALALVAYRQPVTRQEVDSLRGGDSLALLRQLVRLGLISVQRGDNQSDVCYGTTTRFLNLFGLRSLDDLPRTLDLQRM